MLSLIPTGLCAAFFVVTAIAITLFYWSNQKPNKALILILVWGLLLSLVATTGFFSINDSLPPRFPLVVLPAIVFIIYGLTPKQKTLAVANRDLTKSTLLHTIRIPVEICLHYLFIFKAIPEVMTFGGWNFDIISGITAPIMAWLWHTGKASKQVMLAWNFICLGLIFFIVGIAILSVDSPIQQLGLDQSNQAVLFFPYVLLPGIVVPLVIYTHILDIITLRRMK